MNDVLLSVQELWVSYGNIKAIHGISFDVHEGEIVTLIGANGAGKSSTLRAISGLIPYTGKILYKGQELRKISADKIVGMGIAQVPEGRGIFGNLTVLENLKLATWQRKDKPEIARDFERVFGIFPRLQERRNQLGGTLSGGEQQMLAVARALMSDPELLMLDEPSLGLAPVIVDQIFKALVELKRSGISILLVEQNALKSLKISDRAYILETGRIVHSDDAKTLLNDEKVKKSYLGI